jgi:hypothetical protein
MRRMSELTGNSQSAIVGELLDTSMPVFNRVISVLEAAQKAQQGLKDKVAGNLAVAQAQIESQLGLALDTLDDGFRPILEAAEGVRRRAAGAGGKRARPPISNRGVTPHQNSKTAKGKTTKGAR